MLESDVPAVTLSTFSMCLNVLGSVLSRSHSSRAFTSFLVSRVLVDPDSRVSRSELSAETATSATVRLNDTNWMVVRGGSIRATLLKWWDADDPPAWKLATPG